MLKPKHSFASVTERLIQGLESGTVTLTPRSLAQVESPEFQARCKALLKELEDELTDAQSLARERNFIAVVRQLTAMRQRIEALSEEEPR